MLRLLVCMLLCAVLPFSYADSPNARSEPSASEGDALGVYDGHLILKSIVTPRGAHSQVDEQGYLMIMGAGSTYTSFSLDVGFNRGQSSSGWHQKQPHLYVIGIEANAHLARQFEHGAEFEEIRKNTMVIQAAAASRPGVVKFNPGFGWSNVSDTGSIFPFKDTKRESERQKYLHSHFAVRSPRLDTVLKHVPPRRGTAFVWDTLKLDVQGADVDALISSGDYVEQFMCVVGEFETLHYETPVGLEINPAPFLKQHDFVCVYDVYPGNSIWLNKKHFALYKETPERFGCHIVYDSVAEPAKLIAVFEKGGLR